MDGKKTLSVDEWLRVADLLEASMEVCRRAAEYAPSDRGFARHTVLRMVETALEILQPPSSPAPEIEIPAFPASVLQPALQRVLLYLRSLL